MRVILLLLSLALSTGPALAQSALQQINRQMDSVAPVLDKVMSGVVNITSIDAQSKRRQFASGVIIDNKEGYILTNLHVLDGAKKVIVTLKDGRSAYARLKGVDRPTDLAVLKVPAVNLTQLEFADTSKTRVGDFSIAIGNPYGLGHTASSGIVSAIGRTGIGKIAYQDYIQIDTPINPGNSGGALIDFDGKLIGINSALLTSKGQATNIGFAIPANLAKRVAEGIIEHGEYRRGSIGVMTSNLPPNEFLKRGALVSKVLIGSIADRAGINPGDVILKIDNHMVTGSNDLLAEIAGKELGQNINLEILVKGNLKTVPLKVVLHKFKKDQLVFNTL